MKRNIYLTILGLFAFACNKEDDAMTINNLLTNRSTKTWINYSLTTDGTEQLIDCDKDDEWTFSMNGDIDVRTGIVRCQIDQKEKLDYYSFFLAGSNNDVLYFKYKDDTGTFFTAKCNIVTLTKKDFVFRFQVVRLDGSIVNTIEYKFKTPEF